MVETLEIGLQIICQDIRSLAIFACVRPRAFADRAFVAL
jgi:hypothetical protein